MRTGEFVLVVGAGPIRLGIAEFARIAGGEVIVMQLMINAWDFAVKDWAFLPP